MQQYHDALQTIIDADINKEDRTGVGTISIFGLTMKFDIGGSFPLLTTKKTSFSWIAEELFWFLSGSTNVNDLRDRTKNPITIWDDWADEETCGRFGRPAGELGPVYGHQWRNFGATHDPTVDARYMSVLRRRVVNYGFQDDGLDQINKLYHDIRNNPNSRRLILTGWNPKEAELVSLPPCHTLCQFYVENGRLSCQLYQRSADMFLGVPYNIASYSLLTHLFAHSLNLSPGTFVHTIGDAHIYRNHMEQVRELLSRKPYPQPILHIKSDSKYILDYNRQDLALEGYKCHDPIQAVVAV